MQINPIRNALIALSQIRYRFSRTGTDKKGFIMTASAITGYVARKQLANLVNGEADFVALRLDKHNPDDVTFNAHCHQLPPDVVAALQEAYGNVADMDVRLRINDVLDKYSAQ